MGYNPITTIEQNRSLGLTPNAGPYAPLLVGSTGGNVANGTIVTVSTTAQILSTLVGSVGITPLSELAAHCLAWGMPQVDVLSIDTTATGGVIGAVTHVGTGLSVVTVAAVGSGLTAGPFDAYLVRIEIMTGGTNTTATFRYSLDDGLSWVETKTCALSGVALYSYNPKSTPIPCGITVGFSAATVVAGDVYSFTTLPDACDQTKFTTALGANGVIANSPNYYNLIVMTDVLQGSVSDAANIANAQTQAANLVTGIANLFSVQRFCEGMTPVPRKYDWGTEDDSTYNTAIVAGITSSNDRLWVGYGHDCLQSALSIGSRWRNKLWGLLRRLLQQNDPSQAPYLFPLGPLPVTVPGKTPAVSSTGLTNTNLNYSLTPLSLGTTHDERTGPSTGPSGFIVGTSLTSLPNSPTYFSSLMGLKTDPNSDFFDLNNRLLMDRFERVATQAATQFIGVKLATNSPTASVNPGGITDAAARGIEQTLTQAIRNDMVARNWINDIPLGQSFFTVDRTVNLLATGLLKYKGGFVPPGHVKTLSQNFSFQVQGAV